MKLKELQINLIKIENTSEWTSKVFVTSKTLKQLQEYRKKQLSIQLWLLNLLTLIVTVQNFIN